MSQVVIESSKIAFNLKREYINIAQDAELG